MYPASGRKVERAAGNLGYDQSFLSGTSGVGSDGKLGTRDAADSMDNNSQQVAQEQQPGESGDFETQGDDNEEVHVPPRVHMTHIARTHTRAEASADGALADVTKAADSGQSAMATDQDMFSGVEGSQNDNGVEDMTRKPRKGILKKEGVQSSEDHHDHPYSAKVWNESRGCWQSPVGSRRFHSIDTRPKYQSQRVRFSLISHHGPLSKMTTAELKTRLLEAHGEPAPKGWRKNQLLLRLTELEGLEAVQASGPPRKSPLREMEIRINKSARKKSELQQLAMEMNVNFSANDTIQILTLKLMDAAYRRTAGDHTDPVGFGIHSHLTYQEIQDSQWEYCQWVLTTAAEGDACFRLVRLAEWLQANPKRDVNMLGGRRGKKSMPAPKATSRVPPVPESPSPASSNEDSKGNMKTMLSQLAQAVQGLTQKMHALEKDTKEAKRKTSHSEDATTSNSEWEGVNPV